MASNSSSLVLTDHDEIRRWAEERDARPSAVRSTGGDGDIGIIRLDFPGYSGEDSLEEVSWDEWFEKFDESGLALVVQEETGPRDEMASRSPASSCSVSSGRAINVAVSSLDSHGGETG